MVLGMGEIDRLIDQWEMEVEVVHKRLVLAPTSLVRRGCWVVGSSLEVGFVNQKSLERVQTRNRYEEGIEGCWRTSPFDSPCGKLSIVG